MNVKISVKQKMLPFILSILVIILDQISKFLVEKNIPLNTYAVSFWNDFLRISHVTNIGAAFSVGESLPPVLHSFILCYVPLIVLVGLVILYFRTDDFSLFQCWCVSGIIGGGFGNLIDRFFRPAGVVDFIDVKFYGLFGLDRWPTFNIADSFVLVSSILLIISFGKMIFRKEEL